MKQEKDYGKLIANAIVIIMGIVAFAAGITYIGLGIITAFNNF